MAAPRGSSAFPCVLVGIGGDLGCVWSEGRRGCGDPCTAAALLQLGGGHRSAADPLPGTETAPRIAAGNEAVIVPWQCPWASQRWWLALHVPFPLAAMFAVLFQHAGLVPARSTIPLLQRVQGALRAGWAAPALPPRGLEAVVPSGLFILPESCVELIFGKGRPGNWLLPLAESCGVIRQISQVFRGGWHYGNHTAGLGLG